MKEKYRTEAMWTLPVRGTLGRKAENLYRNTATILNRGWRIPRSMVIPYQYYSMQGGIYYMMDDIAETFRDCAFVAVRSNSPDEDVGERNPGLYLSKKINPHAIDREERNDAINDLGSVIGSYNSGEAIRKRKRSGLKERGMSLLVQEWLPTAFCGSFSDLGEIGYLVFTDPTQGIESMIKPSRNKILVDINGEITMNTHYLITYDQEWARELRGLTNTLPNLGRKGWELEFVITEGGKYILQTTPVKKQQKFEVKETKSNIFHNRDVIGSGEFRTNGILYLPTTGFDMQSFDERHKDYCLVVCPHLLTSKASQMEINPLRKANNFRALFCVSPSGSFESVHSFASHVETAIREGECCGLVGRFTNKFQETMSGNITDIHPLFLDTKLLIQADETEQKANVEII
jgi:hypothetical protein